MSVVAFARVQRKELEEELAVLDHAILSGRAKSFDEYREITGERRGLVKAIAIIENLSKKFDEQN